jgi:mycoredoxin
LRKWLTLFVFVIALASYQHWDKLERYSNDGNDFKLNGSHQVVMYSTSWCGYCRKARAFFARNDIAYVEYDIEKSSEAKRQFDKLRGRGVPLIVVGTEQIRGWNPTAVKAALARLKDSPSPKPVTYAAAQKTSTVKQDEGYIIHLRNGRRIEVEDYWERGNKIQYRKLGGVVGVDRKHVVMIESQVDGVRKRYSPIFTRQSHREGSELVR